MKLTILIAFNCLAFACAQEIVQNQLSTPGHATIIQSQSSASDPIPSAPAFPNQSRNLLTEPQNDFGALLQLSQNQLNPYLTPYSPYSQFQNQQPAQPSSLFQASLGTSLPSSLYENLIMKPLNFLKPSSQPPYQYQPTGVQMPYYPIQSQYHPTLSKPQQQYWPNNQQQSPSYYQQPFQPSPSQYYPQNQLNPYQNIMGQTQTSYIPQMSYNPQFNAQNSYRPPFYPPLTSTQVPVTTNPSYQPSLPYPPSSSLPMYNYQPYVPHGQVQYSQPLPTPFLVDLARYIYGR